MDDANDNIGTEEETDEGLPESLIMLKQLAQESSSDLQRLKARKRELVTQARANQITVADLTVEVFDELVSQQQQILATIQTAATAIDGAFVYCDDLADHTGFTEDEDEEGEESGEEEDSWLSKADAGLIGAVIVQASAAIKAAKSGQEVDWDPILSSLEQAGTRIVQIEEKPDTSTH